jgi:hypothetical protein
MILAALVLAGVGGADILREFIPGTLRWSALGAWGVVILVAGELWGSLPSGIVAVAIAAGWIWLLPVGAAPRAGIWPAVALAVVVIGGVLATAGRADGGIIDTVWALPSPIGNVSAALALLIAGSALFLMESANVVVRVSLRSESTAPHHDTEPDQAGAPVVAPLTEAPRLRGGRLIGPLERILIVALTIGGAAAFVAALIAAKGIVRFPEISRDDSSGRGAEYFLVGSLVSWVQAVGVIFILWYAFST